MNKYKFIDYLHHPKKITKDQEDKLIEVVEEYPYFQTARTLIAKIKSEKKDPTSKSYVTAASLYVFDRAYLRKYLGNDLFFIETKDAAKNRSEEAAAAPDKTRVPTGSKQIQTSAPDRPKTANKPTDTPAGGARQKPPAAIVTREQPKTSDRRVAETKKVTPETTPSAEKQEKPQKTTADTPQPASVTPQAPPASDLDKLIEEVFQDMSDLRKSKARFMEWQEKNDMEEAVEKAMAASPAQNPTTAPDTPSAEPKEEAAQDLEQKETQSTGLASTDAAIETPATDDEKEVAPVSEVVDDKPEKTTVKPKPESTKKTTKSTAKKPAAAKKKAPTKKTSATKSSTTPAAKKTTKTAPIKKATSKVTPKKTSSVKKEPKKNAPSSSVKESKKTTKTKDVQKNKSQELEKKTPVSKTSEADKSQKTSLQEKNISTDKEAIIDKFIETQPSISKPSEEETVSKDDLSKKSTRFHADIASEYLAEIYIEQGKKHRAIEIYENMCLKFPEKKSYFAGLIENLKKE